MNSEACPTIESSALSEEQLQELLTASRPTAGVERRASERHPCFAPVNLVSTAAPVQRYSAFSRDISRDGLGLLHNMSIARGTVWELTLTQGGVQIRKRAQAMWVGAAGEGWFLSGWRFVN